MSESHTFNEIIKKWDLRLQEAITGLKHNHDIGDQEMEALYHEKADLIDRFVHDLNLLKWDYT